MSFTIATYNVYGLANTIKRKSIFRYLKNERYDIIFLQETHSTQMDERLREMDWGEISYGVFIQSNKGFSNFD